MSLYPSSTAAVGNSGGLMSPATGGTVNSSGQGAGGANGNNTGGAVTGLNVASGQNQTYTVRPSSGSGGGTLSNAGQMMMSSMHHLNMGGSDRIGSQSSNHKQYVNGDSTNI